MSDKWKASVRTIADKPVALIDLTFTRTIIIDPEVFEKIQRITDSDNPFESIGLKDLDIFYKLVQNLPPESRRFVVVPFTDADQQTIGLQPLSQLLDFFERRAYWRVEGTAANGFTGYFNFGGQDQKVDLSKNGITEFKEKLNKTKQDSVDAFQAGKITAQEQALIDLVCDTAGRDSLACEKMYEAFAKLSAERDRSERERQERDLRDREQRQGERIEFRGDFPRDFGRDFGHIA